jgi:hypothetical protein
MGVCMGIRKVGALILGSCCTTIDRQYKGNHVIFDATFFEVKLVKFGDL